MSRLVLLRVGLPDMESGEMSPDDIEVTYSALRYPEIMQSRHPIHLHIWRVHSHQLEVRRQLRLRGSQRRGDYSLRNAAK